MKKSVIENSKWLGGFRMNSQITIHIKITLKHSSIPCFLWNSLNVLLSICLNNVTKIISVIIYLYSFLPLLLPPLFLLCFSVNSFFHFFFQYSQILNKHILWCNNLLVVTILVWTLYHPWCQVACIEFARQENKTLW